MNTGAAGSLLASLDWVSRDVCRSSPGPSTPRGVGRRRDTLTGVAGARTCTPHARRRRDAAPAGRRRGDLRREPQHQFHERLHQALHLLRLQPRPSRGGRLPAPLAEVVRRAEEAASLAPQRCASRPACRRSSTGATTSTSRGPSPPRCPSYTSTRSRPRKFSMGRCVGNVDQGILSSEGRRLGTLPGPQPRSSIRPSAISSRAAALPSRSGSTGSRPRTRWVSGPPPRYVRAHRARRTGSGTWRCCARSRRTPAASRSRAALTDPLRGADVGLQGALPASVPMRPGSRS